ncbi:MAG: Dyp-type peroxidase, partial [Nitrososphaeraceae archaeon]
MSTKCASLKYVYGYSVGVIQGFGRRHSNWDLREAEEKRLIEEKRKQPGVVFPSASRQEHLLIIRLNLRSSAEKNILLVQNGLRRLCGLFKEMEEGAIKVDELEGDGSTEQYPLSKYNFSSTIGFGAGFFAKLRITRNKPKKLYEMPDHKGLRDPLPYVLLQTDLLIQLGSNRESINRWILQNDSYQTKGDDNDGALDDFSDTNSWRKYEGTKPKEIRDIVTAIGDWAYITDVHSGFQRIDGRNLMGFDDGISNPDRLQNNIVWTADDDERSLVDGTYMVFQKIYHDLEQWRTLSITEQEKWVGRSKATGLLIGTLSKEDDEKLALDCRSPNPVVKRKARLMLKRLLSEQKDPENKLFDEKESIRLECPVWSHVRKSNPRAEGGLKSRIIYRRGYLFMEDTQGGKVFSGLLFICFQKNISEGFEYIKRN